MVQTQTRRSPTRSASSQARGRSGPTSPLKVGYRLSSKVHRFGSYTQLNTAKGCGACHRFPIFSHWTLVTLLMVLVIQDNVTFLLPSCLRKLILHTINWLEARLPSCAWILIANTLKQWTVSEVMMKQSTVYRETQQCLKSCRNLRGNRRSRLCFRGCVWGLNSSFSVGSVCWEFQTACFDFL